MMMNLISSKPYMFLWTLIPVLLVFVVICNYEIDIQMHDTYIVGYLSHFGILFSIFLFFTGGIYWLLRRRKMIEWLTVFHVIVTILGILVVVILIITLEDVRGIVGRKYINFEILFFRSLLVLGGVVIWLLSQAAFIFNIFYCLIKKEAQ